MKKTESRSGQRALLLRLVDEAFDKTAWHGPNLRGSIRQVSAQQAVWRPRAGRHNIAEVVLHCAYWKYAVRRRIRGDKRGSFPLKGSNWFTLPAKLSKTQWRDYVTLLDEEHRALRDAIATTPESRLLKNSGDKAEPAAHVYGIAMHDIYHAGQIRIAKVLHKQATGAGKSPRK
ncbi:MAG: DinB family protein [Planctomycetota bacterium]|jgi:hypothetical protein